jgi:ATP phosphoribosyltransferase
MSEPVTLAIPSKGRLKEQVDAYFAAAGVALKQTAGARGYRATVEGLDGIDVMLLSSSEIASALVGGDVHLGVTGEDLIREAAPELEGRLALLKPLGFGFADVVVAVPRAWIDVSTMADLDDACAAFAHRHRRRLRVATKYAQLTRGFFAHAGISDYRIVASATTGATLKANGLKILEDGVILKSQAQLAMSLAADWSGETRAAASALLARLGVKLA